LARFNLIVLDPPSFSSSKKGKVLRVSRDYEKLVRLCLRTLAPGGRLLAVTNHRGTTALGLRKIVLRALSAEGKLAEAVKILPSGLDCPEAFDGPFPSKSVLLTLREDSP
jgi:23S rRNA (cytosine1962-C5)-methyltransferase